MKQRGFTLIELMITIVVLGILVTVALPTFTEMIKDQRIESSQRKMFSAIKLTRSEASHRNQTVTMTAVGGSWANGIQITVDATGEVIKDIGGSDAAELNIQADGDNSISFQGNGMLNDNMTISICDDRAAGHGRNIEISRTGRVSVKSNDIACF